MSATVNIVVVYSAATDDPCIHSMHRVIGEWTTACFRSSKIWMTDNAICLETETTWHPIDSLRTRVTDALMTYKTVHAIAQAQP